MYVCLKNNLLRLCGVVSLWVGEVTIYEVPLIWRDCWIIYVFLGRRWFVGVQLLMLRQLIILALNERIGRSVFFFDLVLIVSHQVLGRRGLNSSEGIGIHCNLCSETTSKYVHWLTHGCGLHVRRVAWDIATTWIISGLASLRQPLNFNCWIHSICRHSHALWRRLVCELRSPLLPIINRLISYLGRRRIPRPRLTRFRHHLCPLAPCGTTLALYVLVLFILFILHRHSGCLEEGAVLFVWIFTIMCRVL